MPIEGFLGRFRKKSKERQPEEPLSQPPTHNERWDQSMRYIESPSALEYPGVKRKEKISAKDEAKEIRADSRASLIAKELPRCPSCGWAVGFEDSVCMNCGQRLK
jgi:hypothetical protein